MEELTRWADCDQTHRGFVVERLTREFPAYRVKVWDLTTKSDLVGEGEGWSVVFAAVRAFDDLSAKMSEG